MEFDNPYAPPSDPPSAHAGPESAGDTADLYLDTIAPTALRIASGTFIATGILMIILALRLVLAVRSTSFAILIVGVHLILGVSSLAISWGIREGHMWLWGLGFFVIPFVAIASFFAITTGSIGGLAGISFAMLDFVMLAMNYQPVRRIREAKRQLAAR